MNTNARKLAATLFLCVVCINLFCQEFSPQEILQGYANKGDSTYFIFNESHYDEDKPERVVVTGSFRNWSQDMEEWKLEPKSKNLWQIAVYNPKFDVIKPSAEFKFRINDGKWLSAPSNADNEKGGNLVFLKNIKPPSLKAEIRSEFAIWAQIDGVERPWNPNQYRLTDAKGNVIKIAKILPNTSKETLIVPAKKIDKRKVYYLEIPALNLKTFCSFDGWFRHLYSSKELGANISEDGSKTSFRVFSPRATGVKLYLYNKSEDVKAYKTIDMQVDENGVWEAEFNENLKGIYYDFTVHGFDEPGNHFYETQAVHISDPYARVSMDTWGKCRVWEKTKPASSLKNGIPKIEDVIAYEVHVQDFTDLLPVGKDLKGTLPAMVKTGLKNKKGQKIGFDYLVDLGINTVHLMPVQEFLHYNNDIWKASFKDDPYMIDNGINEENYQWGYRTSHCFAVESRFRKRGTEPGEERNQFRDLVQAFHDKNIAVIIDIVPNHTAENMDGQSHYFNFNVLDKMYYYRTENGEHIGAYGNEVKTENRPMTQRWLIDQCKHFIEEFGIDGFRIDLAGQVDEQTLIALKAAIGEDKILYGEPWIGSNDPAYEENPDWDWYKKDSPITFFQDDSRNAFKGPVSNPKDLVKDRGYAGGDGSVRDKVKQGLSNTFNEDKTTSSGINYLDIHDNWALADRFGNEDWNGGKGVEEARFKIAAVLLYTSLGPIVTHGGTEIMRSKASAVLEEIVKETKDGVKIYIHGKRDTYNLRVPNQFQWENVGKTKRDKGSTNDYRSMYNFWRGLNQFRLSNYGKVFRVVGKSQENYYNWIEPKNTKQLGYIVDNNVFVLINVDETAQQFKKVKLPEGNWKLIGSQSGVDYIKGVRSPKEYRRLTGGKELDISLEKTSFMIWVKE